MVVMGFCWGFSEDDDEINLSSSNESECVWHQCCSCSWDIDLEQPFKISLGYVCLSDKQDYCDDGDLLLGVVGGRRRGRLTRALESILSGAWEFIRVPWAGIVTQMLPTGEERSAY